ncbi:MAG: hypothetical protein Q8L54_09805 [Devosia sp.]|nr:hypothetical protein [Devosia sp.]
MTLQFFGRLAGVLTLTAGLAGCIDMTMDIEVLSETTGRATTTSVMGSDFYAMAKAGAASGDNSQEGFCQEDGAQLTENADGSATCVLTVEGSFADLKLDEGDDGASFTVVSPGVVRVAFKTDDMKSELGAGAEDEQTKQMMQAFFEGHAITIRIGGKAVTDTNMTLSDDKKSAEIVIPFLDLINGTLKLPDELYAVVNTN